MDSWGRVVRSQLFFMHLRLQSKLPLQIWPKTRSQYLTQPVSCNPPCSVHFSVTSGLCRLSQTAAKFSWRALEDEGREVDSPVRGVVSASTVGATACLAIVFTVLTEKHVSCLCVQCVCVMCAFESLQQKQLLQTANCAAPAGLCGLE